MKTRTPKGPRVQLEITPEIIAAGVIRDSGHCMIAQALEQSYPSATRISVDVSTIRFTDPKRALRFTYLTPRIAQMHIIQFDRGITPPPIKFQLRAPQVTRSGRTRTPRLQTTAEAATRSEAGRKLNDTLAKQRLVNRRGKNGEVPERAGGKTPPLQTGADNVPFSRRRAFGLRALEY